MIRIVINMITITILFDCNVLTFALKLKVVVQLEFVHRIMKMSTGR